MHSLPSVSFSFLGVVLACPPCFLGFGVLLVSRFFLPSCGFVVGGGGAGCRGVSRVRGWVRPVLLLLLVGGGLGASGASGSCVFVRGVGCVCAWFLLPCVLGGGGWVCLCVWFILGMRFPGVGRAARLFFGGWVCLVSCSCSRCSSVVFAEEFPGVFVSARHFLPLV